MLVTLPDNTQIHYDKLPICPGCLMTRWPQDIHCPRCQAYHNADLADASLEQSRLLIFGGIETE